MTTLPLTNGLRSYILVLDSLQTADYLISQKIKGE